MTELKIDVAKELAALEKAQADYRREKIMEDGTMQTLPEEIREFVSGETGNFVSELGNGSYDGKKLHRELDRFAPDDPGTIETLEKIASDTEASASTRASLHRGMCADLRARAAQAADTAEAVYERAHRRLSQKSDPFNDDRNRAELARATAELSLFGAPKGSAEIVAAVEAAIAGHDTGALMFWDRHFERLIEGTPGTPRASGIGVVGDDNPGEEIARLRRGIDRRIQEHRSSAQAQAFKRLENLRTVWPAIKEKAADTRARANPDLGYFESIYRLRPRTRDEQATAQAKATATAAKARADALAAGEPDPGTARSLSDEFAAVRIAARAKANRRSSQ